jgi:hypothetical protein
MLNILKTIIWMGIYDYPGKQRGRLASSHPRSLIIRVEIYYCSE